MPVPRSTGPTVARRPIDRNPADGGAGVINIAAQGAARISQVIEREVQAADEVVVNEADLAYQERLNSALLDPDRGVLNQTGTNAMDAAERLRDELPKMLSDIEGGLGARRQQVAFRNAARQRELAAFQRIDSHVGAEMRKVDAGTLQGQLAGDREQVAALATLGDAATAQLDELIVTSSNRIATYGARTGRATEETTAARREMIAELRAIQIQALANGNQPERAQAMFDAHQDQLSFKDRPTLKKLIEQSSVLERSQVETDRIMAAHPDDEQAALAEARKLKGEVRARVELQVQARFIDNLRGVQAARVELVKRASS
ncbi:MAG TPA: hypothetical protein VFH61_03540, partial [Thermoleophilia bacterium]|nr:hypothetical protein [Thermoleophilia bacterium]